MARSRKPDLCEEAINVSIYRAKITYTYRTLLLHADFAIPRRYFVDIARSRES